MDTIFIFYKICVTKVFSIINNVTDRLEKYVGFYHKTCQTIENVKCKELVSNNVCACTVMEAPPAVLK